MIYPSTATDFQPLLAQAQQEITDLRSQLSQLQHELNTDVLTGIANRRTLASYAQQLTIPAVVALVDLDQFKPINDTYGHLVGDQVLKVVALRLRAAVVGRGIVARLGGDEFALIIDSPKEGIDIAITAQRVLRAALRLVAAPLALDNGAFTVAASIGAAFIRNEQFSAALHRADIAMYRAKAARAGLMFYDPACHRQASTISVKPQTRVRDLPAGIPPFH